MKINKLTTDGLFFCLGMLNEYIGRIAPNTDYVESFNSFDKAAVFENALIKMLKDDNARYGFIKKVNFFGDGLSPSITFESTNIFFCFSEYYNEPVIGGTCINMYINSDKIKSSSKNQQISYLQGAFERYAKYDKKRDQFVFQFANATHKVDLICDLLQENKIWFEVIKDKVKNSCPMVNEISIKKEDAVKLLQ